MNKKAVAAILAAVFLVSGGFMLFKTYQHVQSLEEKMDSLTNRMQSMSNEVYLGIEQKIQQLQEEILKQNQNFYDEKIKVTGYNEANDSVTCEIGFALKEREQDATISLLVDNQKVKATEISTTHFKATIQLPLRKESAISYISNGSVRKSEKLLVYHPYQELQGRFKFSQTNQTSGKQGSTTKTESFGINLANIYQNNENLKARSCKAFVYLNDSLHKTIDLMPYLHGDADVQTFNIGTSAEDAAAYAAGKIDTMPDNQSPPLSVEVGENDSVHVKVELIDNLGISYTYK